MREACFACGGVFEGTEGPTHPYMLSSPGCWQAYGGLLAREYECPELFAAVHRLTVDAWALQHPGDPLDRRARQSVWVHYAAFHLALRRKVAHARIPAIMQKLAAGAPPPLPPAPGRFDVTLADVLEAGPRRHVPAVTAWAESAFGAWAALGVEASARLELLQHALDGPGRRRGWRGA